MRRTFTLTKPRFWTPKQLIDSLIQATTSWLVEQDFDPLLDILALVDCHQTRATVTLTYELRPGAQEFKE